MHRLLERQLKRNFGKISGFDPEMTRFVDAVGEAYAQSDEDRAMIERSMEISSRELLARNKELAVAENKYRVIFENVNEGIFQVTPAGQFISANPSLARIFGFDSADELKSTVTDIATQLYVDPNRRAELLDEINRHGLVSNWEFEGRRKDGTPIWASMTSRAVRDEAGNLLYFEGTIWDITARKQAESEREELQSKLIASSRQAGMADVATGVLHNVGNVLNSINVSAALAADQLRGSKVSGVAKLAQLLLDRRAELAAYLTQDEKGKRVPDYLARLAEHLSSEQGQILAELTSLVQNVEHVKQIVAMQQNYAKKVGVNEQVRPADLLEDALRINKESLDRHRIVVQRKLEPVPAMAVDKHQVLQILINLITNAKHAMRQRAAERTLTVSTQLSPDGLRAVFQISDTGVGISEENLTRIFSHGFTTREDGHGFGLHMSATAAQSMSGSLTAASNGPGAGATFTLELPLKAAEAPNGARRAA
jgi:PAS domain S-box-containing protein